MKRNLPSDQNGGNFSQAVKNVNSLTLKFAAAVAAQQEDKSDNLVFSSFNAMACLAMIGKGADTATREEFAQTLFGKDAGQLDAEAAAYIDLNKKILAANKGVVELKTANSVWVNSSRAALDGAYKADVEKTFEAKVESRDFKDAGTVPAMNQWGSDATNGLIPKFVDRLAPDAYAILASALYFKGPWTNKFDKKDTKEKEFRLDDGSVSLTPTMKQGYHKGDLAYQQGADYEAVALTYGEDNYRKSKSPSMRLVIIRPSDDKQHARDWLSAQAGTNPSWLEPAAFETDVIGNVELPRMDVKQEHQLKDTLKAMGLKQAFERGVADFSRMCPNEALHLDFVKQDVVFKTDEEGSEAAFITSGGMAFTTSIQLPPKFVDVKFNRSFVVAMQDIATGAVLFTGVINKPNKDMKPATPAPQP